MASHVPLIDIFDPDTPESVTAARLVNAAADHGFIYIPSRAEAGIDVDSAFEISRILFDSPLEEKVRCKIQRNNRGWGGMQAETLDPRNQKKGDFKEAFNFGEFVDSKAQQPIPAPIAPYEARIASVRASCHALCLRILYLFGLGLELDPADFFSSAHSTEKDKGNSIAILRFLRYPPLAESPGASDADVRAGAHSDYGSVTLLFRIKGQAGLEILTRSNEWVPVPVLPPGTESDPRPPILVNIGDLLSYWTNGLFRSTVHRVVFGPHGQDSSETDPGPRYSIAYFCHPAADMPLNPVPSERVRNFVDTGADGNGNPYAQRKVLTANEHLMTRLAESYGELYEVEEEKQK